MSKGASMSDDPITEPEPTPDPTPEPEPTPEPSVDADELKKLESSLRKGFDELARRERELEMRQQPAAPASEDTPELDEDAQKALDAYFRSKYGGYFTAVETMMVETAESELQRYAKENDLDPDEVRTTIEQHNLLTGGTSLKSVHDALKSAGKLVKASKFDPDKERERITAEVMQKLKEEGVRIEDVRPLRAEPGSGRADFNDEDLTPAERYAIAKEATKK